MIVNGRRAEDIMQEEGKIITIKAYTAKEQWISVTIGGLIGVPLAGSMWHVPYIGFGIFAGLCIYILYEKVAWKKYFS